MTTLANLTTYVSAETASFDSAISNVARGMRSLIRELDPVNAQTEKFNRKQAELDATLKRGQISIEYHAFLAKNLKDRYDQQIASLTKLNGVTAAARAGQQQLAFQFGDIATQASSGTPLVQIFGQQIFQVIGALQLMQKESKGLIGFLGGPWGAALTSAFILLTPLVLKMFEAGDAAKEMKDRMADAADGADAWGDAQSLLGKMVTLTTGKIKDQNDVLRASILLQALQAKQQADEESRKARKAIVTGADATVGGFAAMTPGGTGIGQASAVRIANADLSLIGQGLLSGATKTSDAILQLRALESQGKITKKVFNDLSSQFLEFGQATEKGKASQAILDYLESGKLDQRLRTGGGKGGASGGSVRAGGGSDTVAKPMDTRASDRELQNLYYERIRLEQQSRTNLADRIADEQRILAAQTTAAMFEIDAQEKSGEISKQRSERLRAETQENYRLQRNLISGRLDDQVSAEQLRVMQDQLAASTRSLQLDGELARTGEERRRIQLKILDNEVKAERASLQEALAKKDLGDAERNRLSARLAALDTEKSKRAAQIDRQNAGPLAQMLNDIPRTAAEINASFEAIAADGLASLNDGLAQAITGARSFGDVFNRITDQVVADILRIVIQQQLIKPLANLLGGGDWASGVGGGDPLNLGSLGLGIGGNAGGGFNLFKSVGKLIGFANGGSFQIGGRGGIDQNVLSINGIPRAMVSASEIVNIRPGSDRNSVRPVVVQIVGEESSAFAPRVASISGETSAVQVQTAQRRSALRSRQRLG